MKKGFTLIELLIVISIIGILAVALLPNILSAPATARDAGRKATMNSILAALEQYKSASGSYPAPTAQGCLDQTSMGSYFKGGNVPTSFVNAGTAETAMSCATPGVAYYKLPANNQGYSYIVAIRMEQLVPGPNGMAAGFSTSGLVNGTGDYVAPPAGATNSWYYIVQ